MADNEKLEKQMLFNDQHMVLKKLGQGGFGVVWDAYDFSLKNFVAIKELLNEFSEPKFIEMFYKEALIAKNLIHDNIVRVQHFWKGDNDAYYIVMDYVVGKDLGYVMKKCSDKGISLPWGVTVHVTGAVLKALDYANRFAKDITTGKPYGLVYRDASPGNVMIFYDGSVKISDFGIAKTAEELQRKTKKKVVTGKYAYMSPEQIEGEADIDHRSDIFSVGIILCEMLTGQPLFTGDIDTIRKRISEGKPNLEPLKATNMPDGLIDIVTKALEKDRDKRYQTAFEMFRDLRRLLKFRESEELQQDLSNFMNAVLADEIVEDTKFLEDVQKRSIAEAKSDPNVVRIACRDFIMGEADSVAHPIQPKEEVKGEDDSFVEESVKNEIKKRLDEDAGKEKSEPEEKEELKVKEESKLSAKSEPKTEAKLKAKAKSKPSVVEAPVKPQDKSEERGKTVFEEVGDWLAKKYKAYRKAAVRILVGLLVAVVLFLVVDTFAHLTPIGKSIYSWAYPPDIVITTVPSGARVSMQTRANRAIISNQDSSFPIELRKIQPDTYFITAQKDGFKVIERLKKIEEKLFRKDTQRINLVFDFVLKINSFPDNAEVIIDGNKVGYTPWKGELSAGWHTVELFLPGFEPLGSQAEEIKEGRCSLDFTKPTESAIFANVDQRYWQAKTADDNGVKIFELTGQLFKNIDIDSLPRNAMVYIDDSPVKKAVTPQTLAFKAGNYKLRFVDPSGRYEEVSKSIAVQKDSDRKITAYLNKWVSFRAMIENEPTKPITASLRIFGHDISVSKNISNDKIVRVALPPGKYRFVFDPPEEFETIVMKDVNISEVSDLQAVLKYKNSILRVIVLDKVTSRPVQDAYVWVGKTVNKTDKSGVSQYSLKEGTETVKVIANGFLEQSREVRILSGKKEGTIETFFLNPDKAGIVPAEFSPNPATGPRLRPEDVIIKPASQPVGAAKIVCQNCQKRYDVNQRKLRFCLNCGKPLKWDLK